MFLWQKLVPVGKRLPPTELCEQVNIKDPSSLCKIMNLDILKKIEVDESEDYQKEE